MTDYAKELNDSQISAVTYCDGPSLVIAGAGSGKTRVLTYKIAYLLENGYQPWNILALTFTNKAAREMRERIIARVGESQSVGLWMGTFHSIFARILRMEAAVFGFSPNYTIYDASDQKSLIKSIIKEMGLDEKQYKPGTVASRISQAKNNLVLPDTYHQNGSLLQSDSASRMPKLGEIYARYWQRCRQADAMDFDDLLVYTSLLFHRYPEILQRYAAKFRYVLVDEYQDTNYVQHSIVWMLTKEHRKVCVVGDDAQSIYSFRGARIDNILQFTSQYPEAKLFKLEQNYRSTQIIVQAANSLIQHNHQQIPKHVFSQKEEGCRIPVIQAYSDMEESLIVSRIIRNLHRSEQVSYGDMAILYRTNAQSRTFEDTLRRDNLPYRIYGGLSFYQRKEVKDIIAYFRLVVNPNDEEAFKRVVNYPTRGIGATTVNKIVNCASRQEVSLWQVLDNPDRLGLDVNKGTLSKLQKFRDMVSAWRMEVDSTDAYELGQTVTRESGVMADLYSDSSPEGQARQENVQELMNALHAFVQGRIEEGEEDVRLRDFLSEVSLLSDMDTDGGNDENKITLMTVHSAKGLEFDTVFVVGMERDLFPSTLSTESITEMEEERRLFYVALTRAKKHCYLTHAKSRFRYGKTEFCSPSPFLRDIDSCYLDVQDGGVIPVTSSASRPLSTPSVSRSMSTPSVSRTLASPSAPRMKPVSSATPLQTSVPTQAGTLQTGSLIEHERFGVGQVLSLSGEGENVKASVRFRNAGDKQLLLKFARFKIIG